MKLRRMLEDKYAVTILKALYDKEFIRKKGYSIDFAEISRIFQIPEPPFQSLELLKKEDLIGLDEDAGKQLITLTSKGKQFILIFDKLVQFFNQKDIKQPERKFKIEYSLTQEEKNVLLACYQIAKVSGDRFDIEQLIAELYHYEDSKVKRKVILENIVKLSEINLLVQEGKKDILLTITPVGERVVEEQILEKLKIY